MAYQSTLQADDVEFTPEETARYQAAQQKKDQAYERSLLGKKFVRGSGGDPGNPLSAEEYAQLKRDNPGAFGFGNGEIRSDWASAYSLDAERKLAGASSELAQIDRERRTKRIDKKQELLTGALEENTTHAQQAIDDQLAGLLQETGIGANALRSQVGAQLADRGLSRSTMGSQAIGEVTQQELQTKAGQRASAMDMSQQVQNMKDETIRKMQMAREQLETDKADQLESMYNEQLNAAERAQVEWHYRSLQEQAAGSARDKAFVGQMIGSVFQSGASIAFLASDENLKTNIEPSDEDIISFIQSLRPKKYEYKDPKYGRDTQFGFLAQDLEKHPVGRSMVIETEHGKMVDYSRAIPVILAMQKILLERGQNASDSA